MKRLQITAPGRAEWAEAPVPEPGPLEALVKVLGVTTCPHWDLHIMGGEAMFPGGRLEYPYTPGQPGHEAMGEVCALGPGTTGPAVGARVAVWRDAGQDRAGCYAQYVAVRTENLIEVPAGVPDEAVASLELAMCVQVSFDQLMDIGAVAVDRFGVGGLGPAGLVAVQMARAYGAREVVGLDPIGSRQSLGRRAGAHVAAAPDPARFPPGRFTTHSLDAAVDCTGLKASIEFLMDRTKRAVAIFGVLREEVVFTTRHWNRGFALMGYGQHNVGAARRALELIAAGRLDLRPLVTHTLPLSRYAEGVALLADREAVKVMFRPWD